MTKSSFTVFERPSCINRLKLEHFDLVVIGGGITGAGIALDAAARGLKTVLVEKNDFAFGTSSRSTKLIHGGLRYLKQLEFGLVKEVGSERAVIHKLAPHLVIPEKMLLPLYEKKGLGYWLTSIGLMIYDFLAGVKRDDQRRMLTRKQTIRYEPLLTDNEVKGGAIYAEYRTDDARLTIETIKSAVAKGALCLNCMEVVDFIHSGHEIDGVKVRDHLTNETFEIRSKVVVNATGPWVDKLRAINKSLSGKRLHLTKGVHVVLPADKFPIKQAIYFDIPDGRMIFGIPRGRITYVGTTDTNYNGDLDKVCTSYEDAAYIVDGIKATFKTVDISVDDIESSWAGLRPLIHEDGKSAYELSRKDEIFISDSGLISIAGGKLTGYRKMAERVVNFVIKRKFSDQELRNCETETISLTPEPFSSVKEVKFYQQELENKLKPYALSRFTARYLVEMYGKQTDMIIKQFLEFGTDNAELSMLKSQCWYAINFEMAVSLADFFVRRSGLLYFDIRMVIRFKEAIAEYMQSQLGWSTERKSSELASMEALIEEVTAFKHD